MNYPEFKIDEEKCIHCGQCVRECIVNCLRMNDDNIPEFIPYKEGSCIKCQHCFAVCPTGALSIWGKNPETSENIKQINSDDILSLIKSRRSIRTYKQENIDAELLNKLKYMLKYVPTGVNNHSLHFAIVDDLSVMNDIRAKLTPKLIKFLDNKVTKTTMPHFASISTYLKDGSDIIFRGAPHMIIVSTPTNAPCKDIDPTISLSYFELYAQALGLGTLWCGFAEKCFKLFPEFCDYVGVPRGYKLGYVMLFGYPDVNYSRTTQPEEILVQKVPLGGINNSSIFTKTKHYFSNFLR